MSFSDSMHLNNVKMPQNSSYNLKCASSIFQQHYKESILYCYWNLVLNDPHYASPSSGEAYRDRQLTTNFEFWVEIFCVPTCFHVRIPKPCLSVCLSICPYPEKRNHHSFVNISPTLVIDTSMERSSRVLHHGNQKIWIFFFEKVRNSNFDLCWRAEITLASSISVLHW